MTNTSFSPNIKVGVVGFGYVGAILATHLCSRGFDVVGIEQNAELANAIMRCDPPIVETEARATLVAAVQNAHLIVSTDYGDLAGATAIIVTVGTPLTDALTPDLGDLEACCELIGGVIRRGQLVVLKSTVMPGSTERVRHTLEKKSGLTVEHDFLLAYCPERLAEGGRIHDFTGSALADLASTPVVVGGVGPKSLAAAEDLWRKAGLETLPVSGPGVAEMVKLADNWWIDLNIAMANELGMLCERVGVDALEVIHAANSLKKGSGFVNILYPGAGVGGSCLPKDSWFIHHLAKSHGLAIETPSVGRRVNDSMPRHMFDLTSDALRDCGKGIEGANIAVLGLAFKNGTNDIRNTPAKLLVSLLHEAGARVSAFDPWVDAAEAAREIGVSVVRSMADAIGGADAVVLVTPHPEYLEMNFGELAQTMNLPGAVVDGRRAFDRVKVMDAGLVYRAVGFGVPSLGNERGAP